MAAERWMLDCTFVQYLKARPAGRRNDVDVANNISGPGCARRAGVIAWLARVDQISTKTVHKVVEKYPLDMAKPSRNAGFNKLPVAWAFPTFAKSMVYNTHDAQSRKKCKMKLPEDRAPRGVFPRLIETRNACGPAR